MMALSGDSLRVSVCCLKSRVTLLGVMAVRKSGFLLRWRHFLAKRVSRLHLRAFLTWPSSAAGVFSVGAVEAMILARMVSFLVYSCFRWKQSLYTPVKIEHDKHEDKGRSHHAQRPLRAGEHVSIVNLFGVMRQVVCCDEGGQGEGSGGPFFEASSDGNDRRRYEERGDVMKRSISQPERGFSVGLIKVLECFWRDGHDDAVGHGDGP